MKMKIIINYIIYIKITILIFAAIITMFQPLCL